MSFDQKVICPGFNLRKMNLAVMSEQNRVERSETASRMRNSENRKFCKEIEKENQLEGVIRRTALDNNFSKE